MARRTSPLKRAAAALGRLGDWFRLPVGRTVQKWLSIAASAVILIIVANAFARIGWHAMVAALPLRPAFWALFIGSYLLQPLVDWQIFRHWWRLGWRDLSLFLKRRVMNEALFSYAGDAWLLVWAADRLGYEFDPRHPPQFVLGRGDGPGLDPATSPFAAVKDVAITSGLAGNLVTLLMLLLALGLGFDAVLDSQLDPVLIRRIALGFALLIGLSLLVLVNRGRVLSLSTPENLRVFRLHLVRVLGSHVLLVGTWIIALPGIPIETWVQLGALRMVITRLPLPNKELLFAAIAVDLTGEASIGIAALMAAQGALYFACHGLAWGGAAVIDAKAPAGQA